MNVILQGKRRYYIGFLSESQGEVCLVVSTEPLAGYRPKDGFPIFCMCASNPIGIYWHGLSGTYFNIANREV